MSSMVDNMGEICSPDNTRSNGADSLGKIWNLGIWKSDICRFNKFSSNSYFCFNMKLFHESSSLFKAYPHTPSNTPMSVPGMSGMNRL